MDQSAKKEYKRIWLSPPHMSGKELKYIHEAFESNWIAPIGPNIEGFEKDLESYLRNSSYVTAVTSGTAAIHLGLIMLGVRPGDEVLCQTKTFIASVNPVIYLGANPVLIDSEKDTWNMCPELLEKAIISRIKKGKRPKAIIVINLYGMPYKVEQIHTIASKYGIPILEDSAEAIGSSYKNQKCGTFGDFSVLSFNGNKIITTSGGGALISKSEKLKAKAVYLSTQAKEVGIHYSHKDIGYNYRMSNVSAGIGRGQMEVLEDRIASRRRIYNYYKDQLDYIEEISFLEEPEGFLSNRWLTCILLKTPEQRDGILDLLLSKNIEARPSWKPMHMQPIFENAPAFLNGVSEDLFKRGLCLPSGSSMTDKDLNLIIKYIKAYFE